MRRRKAALLVILLPLLLLLQGCAKEGFTTVSGRHVGGVQMEQIDPEELHLKLPPEMKVTKSERQVLPDRILEDVFFDDGTLKGSLRHETLTTGRNFPIKRPVAEFRHLFNGWYLYGITVSHKTLEPKFEHPITYATFPLDGHNCTAFLRPMDGEDAIQGIICNWTKDQTIDIIKKIDLR